VWPAALRQLADATVYALDLPGHGRSAGEGCDSIEAYADTVMAFIDTLSLENIVLIGHSMGGAIAQTLALRHLSQLTALVLIGTSASLRVSDAILGQILPDFEQAIRTINQFAWAATTPTQMVDRGRDLLAQTAPTVLHNDFSACNLFDVRDQLSRISLPTLVVAGTEDKLTPPKNGRFLADHIPQAQFTLLEGAGHMMMVEKPGETAAAVALFLGRGE
jgi:pimeloyl-ACP methyl ester carboxylesterase